MPVSDEPLLGEAVPVLARELEDALRQAGRHELAAQVPALRITRRCACGNDVCSAFYTTRRPMVRWFRRGFQIDVRSGEGAVTVDVVGGEIVYIEVLFRDDVRDALDRALAPTTAIF